MSPDVAIAPIPRAAEALRWGGWSVALACLFLRALVSVEPFPWWDSDPSQIEVVVSGLTPAWSMVVDVLIIAGSGLALLGESLAGRRIACTPTALALAGIVGVGLHAFAFGGGSLEDARLGSTWVAAIAAGLAAMHLCRDERFRRVTLAALAGLVMMLAAKGILQILVEHPLTVRQYREDPDSFLASQGWAKGSISARNFERRLLQPEASGWFGLSNVYASLAAAGFVWLVGWSITAWRQARDERRPLPDGWAGLLSVGAIAAGIALGLAKSKGGFTAAGIGLSLLAGRMLLMRRGGPIDRLPERIGGILAVALVLSALGAVALRGLIGERMGELSLLFRWFYIEGAARIFEARPLIGVGPGGFKDAYMLAKPALSPEEVQSPHSVFFDFAAALGVIGLAWATLWLGWIFALGRRIVSDEPQPPSETAKSELSLILILALVPVTAAAWIELPATTPDAALMRVVGLIGWIGVSTATLALARLTRAWMWIAALGALMLAVHGQIEVAPVWGGSACFITVAIAAAGARPEPPRRSRNPLAPVALFAVAIAWACLAGPKTFRWERSLSRAAATVRPLAELSTRLSVIQKSHADPGDSMPRVAEDLARLLSAPPASDPASFSRAMDTLYSRLTAAAADNLTTATAQAPEHTPTTESMCRMRLAQAAALARLGDSAAALAALDTALDAAQVAAQHPTVGTLGLLANIWSARSELLHQPDLMTRAIDAWARAAALDPYGLTFPLRIFHAELALHHADAARRWASELLRLDTLQRLDELKRLTPEERAEVEQALK